MSVILTDAAWQDIQRMRRKLGNIKPGPGVLIVDSPEGMTISAVVQPARRPQASTSESIGTRQYQVHTMVSDNVDGWDFERGHPVE